jgi:hypothetical protein
LFFKANTSFNIFKSVKLNGVTRFARITPFVIPRISQNVQIKKRRNARIRNGYTNSSERKIRALLYKNVHGVYTANAAADVKECLEIHSIQKQTDMDKRK